MRVNRRKQNPENSGLRELYQNKIIKWKKNLMTTFFRFSLLEYMNEVLL